VIIKQDGIAASWKYIDADTIWGSTRSSNCITNMWNSLPDRVVMADTVNQFKNRLDKHWANYAFLYDYRVNYNGTGNLFVV